MKEIAMSLSDLSILKETANDYKNDKSNSREREFE
jgi:hypothetical protein